MTTSSKQHRIHDYMDRHFAAIASISGQLALIALIVTLFLSACLALVIFSDTTLLLLQLLQWIGKDCIWCIITPS
ncbi:hypothetical protein [Glaciimonas sp. PCH181]|uniref:hypothetical protein n=1 Tax=Glaciimonas sp. PCH181 TaxID=2133943 RepID=UPI000D36C0F2|nr:hypothetical protein [Glaciimonas sp. PCH181]PUA18785.1 hypothetical protein C7W93_02365 [Glaciimonas sp. PCH181]